MMEKRMTNGYVADELLKGNWQILNTVLEDALKNTDRDTAIRNIHFGWIYFAGYYAGSGQEKMCAMVEQWDRFVGFKL